MIRQLWQRDSRLKSSPELVEAFRSWGYFKTDNHVSPKILMAAGHGYGNVGDEAQCNACIARWRSVAPDCKITLFTPNPNYTEALHNEAVEWAPRVAWFRANTNGCYFGNPIYFTLCFYWLRMRIELSHILDKLGIPLSFLRTDEQRILLSVARHDIVHISGGGFLTGKTKSRLWENCLLMRCCQLLKKPYILTGHNIGVFQSNADRKIAHMGLKGAHYIGLRDQGVSESELCEIGIKGAHVESTCDDALTCDRIPKDDVYQLLQKTGLDTSKTWVAVNFHHHQLPTAELDKITKRFAQLCDHISEQFDLQVVVIAMTPSDVGPEALMIEQMHGSVFHLPYSPDFKVVRGVIAESAWVFTMKHHPIVFAQGECVPVIAIALDDYYYHKNLGALKNTSHSEYLISYEEFYGQKPEALMTRITEENESLRNETASWLSKMRAVELKPYKSAIEILRAETTAE